MNMRWNVLIGIAVIVAVVLCITVTRAQPVPDYEKNMQIRMSYQDGRYTEVSQEVRYGRAPNLNILSGTIRGVISDNNGREQMSFSFREPGAGTGDIVGSSQGDVLFGYFEQPASGEMVITLPYLPGMQRLDLSDARTGAPLASVDLSPAIGAFCVDYPQDPDCLSSAVRPGMAAQTGTTLILIYGALLSGALLVMAFVAVRTRRRKKTVPPPEKETILIVDDDPDIAHILRLLLDRKGYTNLIASGGQECLDILKKERPGVILLDIMMAPMDGWQTLEQIKENPLTREIPVLMITAKQLTAAEAHQYHICIEDYLIKPFDQNTLYAAVEQVLMRKRKIRESLVIANDAGIDREMFCEFARHSRRVSVNRKLIGLLEKAYPEAVRDEIDTGEDHKIIEQLVITTQASQDRLDQLEKEIGSAFVAKGLAAPSW